MAKQAKRVGVVFTEDAELPQANGETINYRKGETHILRFDQAQRWINRNKAVQVSTLALMAAQAAEAADARRNEPMADSGETVVTLTDEDIIGARNPADDTDQDDADGDGDNEGEGEGGDTDSADENLQQAPPTPEERAAPAPAPVAQPVKPAPAKPAGRKAKGRSAK